MSWKYGSSAKVFVEDYDLTNTKEWRMALLERLDKIAGNLYWLNMTIKGGKDGKIIPKDTKNKEQKENSQNNNEEK